MTPEYLLEKIARHGAAVERLKQERLIGVGEFCESGEKTAIAFDAADFVWAYLAISGHPGAHESRAIRNHIAESIIQVLDQHQRAE
ncbi:hypothetical protein [Hydrogenophaga aquatica]